MQHFGHNHKKVVNYWNNLLVHIVAKHFSFNMSLKTLKLVENWYIYDDISKYTKLYGKFSKFLITQSNLDHFQHFWVQFEAIFKAHLLAKLFLRNRLQLVQLQLVIPFEKLVTANYRYGLDWSSSVRFWSLCSQPDWKFNTILIKFLGLVISV